MRKVEVHVGNLYLDVYAFEYVLDVLPKPGHKDYVPTLGNPHGQCVIVWSDEQHTSPHILYNVFVTEWNDEGVVKIEAAYAQALVPLGVKQKLVTARTDFEWLMISTMFAMLNRLNRLPGTPTAGDDPAWAAEAALEKLLDDAAGESASSSLT